MSLAAADVSLVVDVRANSPHHFADRAAQRVRSASLLGPTGRLLMVAADHPARGALAAGSQAEAMANRERLLERLCEVLSRPEVNGVLGTPDILEDLLLLGALDSKVVVGSMNRGGLAGTTFEMDDRFTGYDAAHLAGMGFDGGKMLLRIDPSDPATAGTLAACAQAVTDLADRRLMAMIEPFFCRRVDGRVRNDLDTRAVVRSVTVAAGLGATSAYTWLKLPVTDDVAGMAEVLAASTLPALLLGGEVPADADAALASFAHVLGMPTAKGLVLGRSLLFPADGDVAGAVDRVVSLL